MIVELERFVGVTPNPIHSNPLIISDWENR